MPTSYRMFSFSLLVSGHSCNARRSQFMWNYLNTREYKVEYIFFTKILQFKQNWAWPKKDSHIQILKPSHLTWHPSDIDKYMKNPSNFSIPSGYLFYSNSSNKLNCIQIYMACERWTNDSYMGSCLSIPNASPDIDLVPIRIFYSCA